jgi:hypothetical protein
LGQAFQSDTNRSPLVVPSLFGSGQPTTEGLPTPFMRERSGVAMPHGEICPYADCAKCVADWFIEWYLKPQQYEIGKQRLAMDCPWCRRPVIWQGQQRLIAPVGIPVEVRSYQQATHYARSPPYNQLSLEAFLMDPREDQRTEPFRKGYWPNVNLP